MKYCNAIRFTATAKLVPEYGDGGEVVAARAHFAFAANTKAKFAGSVAVIGLELR